MVEIIWNNKTVIKGEYIAVGLVLVLWLCSLLIAYSAGQNSNVKVIKTNEKPTWMNEE
jgi:hypothetical protein